MGEKLVSKSLKEAILEIIKKTTQRQEEIILKRWGLKDGQKRSLQSLGNEMEGLSRERIRQIENQAISKLKEHLGKIISFKEEIYQILQIQGGIAEERFLLRKLEERKIISEEKDKNAVLFILHKVFSDDFERIVENKKFKKGWKIKQKDLKEIEEFINHLKKVLERKKRTLHLKKDQKAIEEYFRKLGKEFNLSFLESLLEISKEFKKDLYGKWGLAEWPQVALKNLREKITLILKEEKKPLHYRKIAERINEHPFFQRKVKEKSVHNELIREERFVLIGKGKYKLKNHGICL